ncbi:acetyltransferase [Desulforhopalus singaporensis]|uniref:Acetyltransferase n=2 Tax=Desulforhopalus singaporensis TaxID=91360 RepID=A0A1H0STM7_9BACT|nr:acetyltransferase [Desulforhopalus singaporensis]
MGQFNLNRLLDPQEIAVIGGSNSAGTVGNIVMKNLVDNGFTKSIFPVNPKYKEVLGIPSKRSVSELDEGIDLAIIATPIRTVPGIIRECIDRKMGGAVVLSAGGREAGESGRLVEQEIHVLIENSGFRIVGPNCLGIIQTRGRLNATFVSGMPATGSMALVSQSGAICSSILDLAFKEQIGFSHFISIGSMLDVDFGDMIDYLGNDPAVKSILLYIENLKNFRKFMSAARSVSRVKPIIVLKAGKSTAGAKAAASHTGAMAGEDAVYDAAFKRAGLVRVDTIEELFDCAELMAKQPRPKGPRLGIITNGGGPGVMAADFLSSHGYEPVPLDPRTVAELDEVLPVCWSRSNPIDILGDATFDRLRQTLEVCLASRNFDGMLVIFVPQAMTDPVRGAKALVETIKRHRYPVFACWMGGKSVAEAIDLLNNAAIPTFDTPERAVRAFLYMVTFTRNQEMLLEVPRKVSRDIVYEQQKAEEVFARYSGETFVSEADVHEILKAYNLPIVRTEIATSEDDAVRLSRSVGYPVVIKLLSPDITHKTDAGGVQLDLRSDQDVRTAYRCIMAAAVQFREDARIDGVSVQPFLAKPDFEILLGAKRDPDFGPVILFGMGGIFTEVLRDRALALVPMNRLLARRLMQETKAFRLLQGYRNRPPADFEKLEEMIVCLSQLLVDFPQISELDMNPVIIKDTRPVAVDARMLVLEGAVSSPMHLVISPYPGEEISRMVDEEGTELVIRPVRPEDAPLFSELFKVLSPTTIYHRFFGVMTKLPPELLSRFTQIDYDREIALAAIDEAPEHERMLGGARIVGEADGKEGEIAVLVGDPWQGKGIGAGLMRRCLDIAEKRGFKHITGTVLKENRHMIALARKMGFKIDSGDDCQEYTIQISLNGGGGPARKPASPAVDS